ncbi:MAG: hypothetical protein ACTSR0_02415 [Candidatus Asgardarchaeia archaeon]
MSWKEYVRNFELACASDNTYILTLDWNRIEDALNIISKNAKEIRRAGPMINFEYKSSKITFFMNGKVVVKNLEGKPEHFLDELFKE